MEDTVPGVRKCTFSSSTRRIGSPANWHARESAARRCALIMPQPQRPKPWKSHTDINRYRSCFKSWTQIFSSHCRAPARTATTFAACIRPPSICLQIGQPGVAARRSNVAGTWRRPGALKLRSPPAQCSTEQTKSLACSGRTLQQGILFLLQRQYDFFHVQQLHLIRLEWELDPHPSNGVARH